MGKEGEGRGRMEEGWGRVGNGVEKWGKMGEGWGRVEKGIEG